MNHDIENFEQTILEATSDSGQQNVAPSSSSASGFLGKLFFDTEQATYTFLFENEVICLHYDQRRQSIFLNGRRVNTLLDDANMPEFLAGLKKALLEHKVDSTFMRAFDLQVSQIFMGSPL